MKLGSALRTAYRSRTIVRSGASGLVDEAKLHRAIALTQLALLALCGARVGTDWIRGPRSHEGSMALALFVVLAMSLVTKAIGWAIRPAVPAQEHSWSPSSTPANSRALRRDRRM
jgi:hypothetical protein